MATIENKDPIKPKKEAGGELSGKADWLRYMDDIAEGVEARLDSLTGHIMNTAVTEQTIDIARNRKIPYKQIEKWVNARRRRIGVTYVLDEVLEYGTKSLNQGGRRRRIWQSL